MLKYLRLTELREDKIIKTHIISILKAEKRNFIRKIKSTEQFSLRKQLNNKYMIKLDLLISNLEEKFGKQKTEALIRHTTDLNNNLKLKFLQQVYDGNISIDDNQYTPITDELLNKIKNDLLSLSFNQRKEYILDLINNPEINLSEPKLKNILLLYKEELQEIKEGNKLKNI